MTQRPKPQLTLAPADKIIDIAGWAALILLWFVTLMVYASLPETIPTHFNAAGQADDHGSKMMILFIPAIGTLLFAGLTVINYYPQAFNFPTAITAENAQRQYANATRMIRTLRLSIVIIFSLLVFLINKATRTEDGTLGFWFLPCMLAIILIPLGFFTFKAMRDK